MTPTRIPVVNPAVIFQAVIDEAVLVDPETGASLVLNHTGILVWQQIDGQRSSDDLTAALAAYYAMPLDQLKADVEALLDTLAAQGFIRYAADSASDASGS